MLAVWKADDIRSKNPLAESAIYEDYSGWYGGGSCEVGPDQFIATTAWKVCQDGLSKSEDPEIASCDFYSQKVSSFAKAYWLYAIGYNAGLTDAEKVGKLFGWNQLESYRIALVADATKFNSSFTELGLASGSALTGFVPTVSQETRDSSFLWFIARLLGDLGMLDLKSVENEGNNEMSALDIPETQVWASSVPVDSAYGITWEWVWPIGLPANHSSVHLGIDRGCTVGDEVYAVADGYIENPSNPAYKNDPTGWGLVLWLNHGNGLWSIYGHLSGISVQYGQKVSKGDVIGACGATGHVTGPHLHFGMSTKGPDKFVKWFDTGPGWIDPTPYLGGEVSGPAKIKKTADTTESQK